MVLIKSLYDGSVDYTDLLPLSGMDPGDHLSKDARARYGDSAVDTAYHAEVTRKNAEMEDWENEKCLNVGWEQHSSRIHSQIIDPAKDVSSVKGEDEKMKGQKDLDKGAHIGKETEGGRGHEEEEHEEVDDDQSDMEHELDAGCGHAKKQTCTVYEAFVSLVQFFEDTMLETLKPTTISEQELPTEICEMILGNVSDMQTYNACLKVSRRFRSLCQQRPLVMDDVVFLEPLLDGTESTSEEEISTPDRSEPDFRAYKISSGRQMDINIRFERERKRNDVSTCCLIVVGFDWNRRTFAANTTVTLSGLETPAPWVKEPRERNRSVSDDYLEMSPAAETTINVWNAALRAYHITTENSMARTSIADLGEFWETVMRVFDIELKRTGVRDWELPPNTLEYTADYLSRPDSFNGSFFHYMFLRLKRGSKYWDSLWEDIEGEAEQRLGTVDNCSAIRYSKLLPKDRVVGADEPFVLLNVGNEVRLFKWVQGFDDSIQGEARKKASSSSSLRELEPCRTYIISKAEDREAIVKFLTMVVERRKVAAKEIAEEEEREGLSDSSRLA